MESGYGVHFEPQVFSLQYNFTPGLCLKTPSGTKYVVKSLILKYPVEMSLDIVHYSASDSAPTVVGLALFVFGFVLFCFYLI